MIFTAGTYVRIRYTVRLESGEIVKGDPCDSLASMDFVTGFNQVLPGLEKRLLGLKQGDAATIIIPPDEGFGSYDATLVTERTFDEFPEGRALQPGRWVLAESERYKAKTSYYVKDKGPNTIVLDYNHPLAGRTLIYNLTIIEARPARQEELALIRPCDFEPGGRYRAADMWPEEESAENKEH